MNDNGLHFTCKIGELSEDTFSVYKFTHEEAMSELFILTLHVATKEPLEDLANLILQQATFKVIANGSEQRTVSGLVETIEQGKSGFRRTHYKIIIRPSAWLLTLRQDSRIFHFKSIPQILEEMFQYHNVQFSNQLNDEHLVREYVTQKRETDYQFLKRLSAEEGITFWFEQIDDENEQIFYADTRLGQKSGVSLTYNLHPQTAETGDMMSDLTFSVTMKPNMAIHKDRNYKKTAYDLIHQSSAKESNEHFAIFESYGRFEDDAPGKTFTKYRLEALQAETELGRATTNCFSLMPGVIFSISEHPDSKLNANWQVIRVSHQGYCPQALEEEADNGPTVVTNQVEFISSEKEWRPAYIHKPVPDANEIAEVVGPAGEEIHTNEYGCVKVHFHWNRYDAADDKASAWVRVSNQWAGNGFGSVTLPRIGQEVIITYVDGDIDRPIVSGRYYNDLNKPPYELPAHKTKMVWRSKSHKAEGFNEISFEDESGQEQIYIHGQKDFNSLINNDVMWDIHNDHKIKIGNNNVIEITGNSDFSIKGETKIKREGSKSESNSVDSHLKVGTDYVIDAGNEISAKANSKITLDAGTELTIKAGGQFIALKPSGIFTSSPFNMGAGSPGKGKKLKLKIPGIISALLAPTLTQQNTLKKDAPFCEECERCKRGECDIGETPFGAPDNSDKMQYLISGGGFAGGATPNLGMPDGIAGLGGLSDLFDSSAMMDKLIPGGGFAGGIGGNLGMPDGIAGLGGLSDLFDSSAMMDKLIPGGGFAGGIGGNLGMPDGIAGLGGLSDLFDSSAMMDKLIPGGGFAGGAGANLGILGNPTDFANDLVKNLGFNDASQLASGAFNNAAALKNNIQNVKQALDFAENIKSGGFTGMTNSALNNASAMGNFRTNPADFLIKK